MAVFHRIGEASSAFEKTENGYVVEFSGFGTGGSTAGIIKSDEKTVNASYAITYYLDSGTNPENAPADYIYATGATLPTPTKSGYTFGGWYTDSGLTTSAGTVISTTDTGTKEYWAKWTVVTSSDDNLPTRTITVTETSSDLFADNKGGVLAEANVKNAFSNSVEVKVTDTGEDTTSFGFGTGTDVYPFDISLYIKGTSTKTDLCRDYIAANSGRSS